MRFQSKLIMLLLAVLAAVTLTVSLLVFKSQDRVITRQVSEEIEYLASTLTQSLDRLLFERMADIRFLAGDPTLTLLPFDRARITKRLTRHRDIYGYYSSLSFFDPERIRLADTENRRLGERHPPTEYWPEIEAGNDVVVALDWSSSERQLTLHFAARVKGPGEETLGVVVSRMPLGRLLKVVVRDIASEEVRVLAAEPDRTAPPAKGLSYRIAVVDADGLLLYSTAHPEKVLREKFAAWSLLEKRLAAGRTTGRLRIEEPGGEGRIAAFARETGYRNFNGLGWTTIIHIGEDQALAEIAWLRNRLLAFLALLAGLSVLGVCLFSRRVTRPLGDLTATAAEVRRGNLEARAEVASRDEFGQLAATFNAMVADLQRNRESLIDFNRELGRKVEERTAELKTSKERLEVELAERSLIQEALADSHDYLEKIINTVADPIFVKSEEFRFILVNDSFCRFTGYSCDDLIGKTDFDIVPTEEAEIFRNKDKEVLASGEENVNEEQITIAGRTSTIITKKALHTDRRGNRYVVGIFRDVTAQTSARQALEESEERFRAIAETASDALVLADQKGQIVYWNPAAESIFGYSEEEILGRPVAEFIPGYLRSRHERGIEKAIEAGGSPMFGRRMQGRGLRRDGSEFPLELSVNSWTIKGERHFSAIIRDITDRKVAEQALRESEERFRQIAENIREVFWMTNPEHTEQIYISPAYEEIWGRSRKSWYAEPESWFETIHPEDREKVREASATRETSGDFDEVFRILRPDGEVRWIHDRAYPILNQQGEVYRIVGIAEDVTEQKRLEKELQELLLRDELTGLYNRRGFMALAEQQLKTAQRKRRELSLSFIDLDNMKWINDHQGHQAGDEALQQTAKLLQRTFRESDIRARVGGDEFAVAAIDTDRQGAVRQAGRLREMVDSLNAGKSLPFELSLSIGTATYDPNRPETLERLINRADHRMYQEKQRKKPQPMP